MILSIGNRLRSAVRKWLGTDVFDEILDANLATQQLIAKLYDKSNIQTMLMARIVAKLEPNFTRDPSSKEAREESDRIGAEVIRKIEAEYAASRKMTP
jgi:hypothetical protein